MLKNCPYRGKFSSNKRKEGDRGANLTQSNWSTSLNLAKITIRFYCERVCPVGKIAKKTI